MANAIEKPPFYELQRGGGKVMDLMVYRSRSRMERDLRKVREDLRLYLVEAAKLTVDELDDMADLIAEECEIMRELGLEG